MFLQGYKIHVLGTKKDNNYINEADASDSISKEQNFYLFDTKKKKLYSVFDLKVLGITQLPLLKNKVSEVSLFEIPLNDSCLWLKVSRTNNNITIEANRESLQDFEIISKLFSEMDHLENLNCKFSFIVSQHFKASKKEIDAFCGQSDVALENYTDIKNKLQIKQRENLFCLLIKHNVLTKEDTKKEHCLVEDKIRRWAYSLNYHYKVTPEEVLVSHEANSLGYFVFKVDDTWREKKERVPFDINRILEAACAILIHSNHLKLSF